MNDYRNIDSDFSSYFVSNVNYKKNAKTLTKIKNGVSFIHSKQAVDSLNKVILREEPQIAHLHNIYHQLTPSIIPILKKNGVKGNSDAS